MTEVGKDTNTSCWRRWKIPSKSLSLIHRGSIHAECRQNCGLSRSSEEESFLGETVPPAEKVLRLLFDMQAISLKHSAKVTSR